MLTAALVRRAPWLLVAAILAGLLTVIAIQRTTIARRDTLIAKLDGTIKLSEANVRAATAAAQLADLEHKARVEDAQRTATEKADASLQVQLADARARAADLSRRLRDQPQAPAGGGDRAAVPQAPDSAGGADGAGRSAVVAAADDQACAEAVTKAQGWQDWWRAQGAVGR